MDRPVRRLIAFACAGETLVGSLDGASGTTGLLIVSGGNEVRAGAHRGMALLAGRLAQDGVPVFRFDRRGVGDSAGENGGFRSAQPDLAAAAAVFRAEAPQLRRVVGFGNCDAASALALFGRAAGLDALVLANPWVVDEESDLPPAAAIRRRYADRLRRPWTLLRGVDPVKLARGLAKLVRPPPGNELADEVVAAIRAWGPQARIVLAQGDNTAVAFVAAATARRLTTATTTIDTASHSFARAPDVAALEAAIRAALA